MPDQKPRPGRRPEKKAKPEVPSKVDHRRWLPYIVAAIVIVILMSRWRGEKVEAPLSKQDKISVTSPAPTEENGGPEAMTATGEAEAPVPTAIQGEANHAPEVVSIKLSPEVVYPGTTIKAETEGKDADDDPVTFNREWQKNGEMLPGEIMDELDTKGFKKGDIITLCVTPFDDKDTGKRKCSSSLMVSNRSPEITSTPPSVNSSRYTYEVKANDPDGDKLTYSLEGAPPGMTIDAATGRIEWNVPPVSELKSDIVYNIKIVATDGHASAFQGFSLSLKKEFK